MEFIPTQRTRNGPSLKTEGLNNVKRLKPLPLLLSLVIVFQVFTVTNAEAIDLPGSTPVGPSSPIPGNGPRQCEIDNPISCNLSSSDVGSSPGSLQPVSGVGNPINLMSGNKFQSESDFSLPGSQLMFKRMYNSSTADTNVRMGMGWRHSYAVSLVDTGDGNREIVQSNGARLYFSSDGVDDDGNQLMRAVQSNHGFLVQQDNRHQWHLSDGRVLSFLGSFLIKIDWPDQRMLKLYYRSKRLESVTDETGRVLFFTYTAARDSGLGTFQESRFASEPGQVEKITLPDGSVIGYDYDNNKNLSRVRFPDGTNREYHFEDEVYTNHLTGVTDRMGVRFASWSYDEQGRAISSEHANGVEKVTLQYPTRESVDNGEVVETIVTNSLGEQSVYSWQRNDDQTPPQLLSSHGAGCATCPPTGMAYEYDDEGRLSAGIQTDSSSNSDGSFQYQYDELGRLVGTTQIMVDAHGVSIEKVLTQIHYKGRSLQPLLVKAPSVNASDHRITQTKYDDANRPVLVVERGYSPVFDVVRDNSFPVTAEPSSFDAIERRTSLTWEDDRLVAIDGPRNDVDDIVYFEWDAKNRLIAVVPPAAPALRITKFDLMGRAVHFQIGNRSPIELSYNASGKVVQSVRAGNVLNFIYDAESRLKSVTDPDGYTKSVQHDAAGRVKSITDEVGRISTIVRDTESRMIGRALLGVDGSTVRLMDYLFDDAGHLLRSTDQRMGGSSPSTQVLEYDSKSRNDGVQVSDALTGANVRTVVDLLSRVTTLTGIDGAQTQVGFDHQGGIVSVLDAKGNITLSPTDDFGRTVMKESADTGRVINRFDESGNRIQQQLASGVLVNFQYDAANRRVRRDAGGQVTTWRWDELSGVMLEASNETATELFEYDLDARLVSHTRLIDGHELRTDFAYDARGRLAEKSLPDGQKITFHFHDTGANRGKLRAITRDGLLSIFDNTIAAEIDLERRDGSAGYLSGNGVRTTETIAPNGELSKLEIGGSLAFNYTFDAAGRIVRIDRNDIVGQHHTTYAYSSGRLSKASSSSFGTQSWRYDSVGNRLSQETIGGGGALQRASYNYPPTGQGSRLLGVENDWVQRSGKSLSGNVNYAYDAAGAPLQVGDLEYTYDHWQRPVRVSRAGVLIGEYAYNAFGERVKKVLFEGANVPQISYYLYDGSSLSAEANGSGKVTRQYIYLEGHRPIAMLRGSDIFAIHTDHIGAPRQMSNATGEIVWRADYQAFGQATVDELSSVKLNLRFPGQYADAETGTYYNYFRDYDPESGRYRTSDPLGLLAGLNTYAYANGVPQSLIDPEGLDEALVPVVAGSAFFAWLTAASIGTGPPGWVVGAVVGGVALVGVGVASYWYGSHNAGSEDGFLDQTANAKPTADDFNAVRFELERFDPAVSSDINDWDGSWGGLFQLQNQLLAAQRAYLDRTDAYMAANGGSSCLTPGERRNYADAEAAILAAGAVASAQQYDEDGVPIPVPIPGTWSGVGNGTDDDPECRALRARVVAAKAAVGLLGGCKIFDPPELLELKRLAWLEEATARTIYDQRCWSGGNATHQDAQAAAWTNVGRCARYLLGNFTR